MKKPIRILQHMRVLDSGGIEAFIFANLRAMNRDKVIFDFLVTRDQKEFYDEEVEKLGCKKIILNYKRFNNSLLDPLSQAISFYRFCRDNKNIYDIIHFQSIGANGFLDIIAAKFAGIPYRIAHSHIANDIKPSLNSKKKSAGYLRKKFVIYRQKIIKFFVTTFSTHYLGCSKMACEWMYTKKINNIEKAIVVNNPIEVEKFKYCDEEREKIRKELKLEDKYVIGHIGRFVYSKNHTFLLETFSKLKIVKPDAVLMLVGGGKLKSEIENKISELNIDDSVILYGETSEVNKIYNAFDLFLFPSYYEGLGIVLVEGQANGLPIIASSTIPNEVKLTENFFFLNLSDGSDKWVEFIRSNKNLNRKNDNFEIVLKSGYDIKDVSSYLQKLYNDLAQNKGD